MKISNKILLGLFAAIALNVLTGMVMVRSSLGPDGVGNGDTYIEGAGPNKKVRLAATDFSEITMSGNYEIHLMQGTEEYVEIAAQENIVDFFKLVQYGKTLTIDVQDEYTVKPTDKIIITLGFKNLTAITGYGVAKFFSEQTLTFDNLYLGFSGAGYIQTPINAKSLDIQLNGAANAKLSGTATELGLTIDGGARFMGNDLVVQTANATANGAGFAELHVTEYLNAQSDGGASIEYKGNPKVDQRSNGAGRVYKK